MVEYAPPAPILAQSRLWPPQCDGSPRRSVRWRVEQFGDEAAIEQVEGGQEGGGEEGVEGQEAGDGARGEGGCVVVGCGFGGREAG